MFGLYVSEHACVLCMIARLAGLSSSHENKAGDPHLHAGLHGQLIKEIIGVDLANISIIRICGAR